MLIKVMKVSAIKFTQNTKLQHNPAFHAKRKSTQPQKTSQMSDVGVVSASASAGVGAIGLLMLINRKNVSKFAKTLANSMSVATNHKVNPKSLASVMDSDELLNILPTLKKENYVFNAQNVENGVFRADLHSHSNYSDGAGIVKELLDNAAEYADKLYSKTKQKFIFALTDHDTAEGLKEALSVISENPQKYKNLRFIPGIEMSFAHLAQKSSNPCEMSEVLVYGVNPYSENINKFLGNIKQKRINMINNVIAEAQKLCNLTKFSFEEFAKYYDFKRNGNLMNIHWKAFHYIETKQAITVLASQTKKNPEALYAEIMKDAPGVAVGTLKAQGKLPHDIPEEAGFKNILKKYAPHFKNDKLVATSENTFDEIVDTFSKEPNIFMAFAHPCCFAQHINNPAKGLKYFTDRSKGMIKASESFHQAYQGGIKEPFISNIQKETEKLGLLNLGGRDNHNAKLF